MPLFNIKIRIYAVITKILIENILIIFAEAFWIISSFAQLKKLVKTRDTKGLYAPTVVLNGAGNIAWVSYFAIQQLWVPFSTNIVSFGLTAITLAYLLTNKKHFVKAIISIAIIGPLTAILIINYPDFSGWTAMIFNTIASTPWLIHVIRTKKTSGISEGSLFFVLSAIICTFIFAIMTWSLPLIAGCIQNTIYLVIIMIYYYRYRGKKN